MKKRLDQQICLRLAVILVIAGFAAGCAPAAGPEATATRAPTAALSSPSPSPESPVKASLPCSLAKPGPEDWPVVKCETFDENSGGLQVESQDNPIARYNSRVEDGRFVVDYAAKGFAGFQRETLTWFNVARAQDFALSVEGQLVSRFDISSWGLAFSADEEAESFYLFTIYNDATYKFEIYEDGDYTALIPRTLYGGIQVGEANTLSLITQGGEFTFLINGQEVNTYEGGRLEGMGILLAVSAQEGASALFSFDNLILQV